MANICLKEIECKNCRHFKYDVDYGEKVCYASIDNEKDYTAETHTIEKDEK